MLDTIPSLEERQEIHQVLKALPDNESLFKCHNCKLVFDIYSGQMPVLMALIPKDEVHCPDCKTSNVELLCKVDAYSVWLNIKGFSCRQGMLISGVDICPICKQAICPQCCNHSVVSLSRVTGYIQDVSGWNEGKKQELLDRKRYTALT